MFAKRPDRVISLAVQGMLPKTKLGKAMAKKLKVYADADHPHTAQRPEVHTLTAR
jgi:large subunit ribosomal protein L13